MIIAATFLDDDFWNVKTKAALSKTQTQQLSYSSVSSIHSFIHSLARSSIRPSIHLFQTTVEESVEESR